MKSAVFVPLLLPVLMLTACVYPKTAREPAPPVVTQPPTPVPEPVKRPSTTDRIVNQLLDDAGTALLANMLMTPEHDNAFDRYKAVLTLQPDNREAQKGLREIFISYAIMTRDAIARRRLIAANDYYEKARLADPDNPELAALDEEMVRLREQVQESRSLPVAVADNEVLLNAGQLAARDESMTEQLQALAVSIREEDGSMLIVARSDEEGRWIYRQMALGVLGYRLRGDMQIGRQPKIVLLPSIDDTVSHQAAEDNTAEESQTTENQE